MGVSSIRTLVWSPTVRLLWRAAQPDDDLDYSIDFTAWLADIADSITSASWSAKPSGTGELQVADPSVAGGIATVWLSGGVPAREYSVKCEIATLGARTFELIARLPISRVLATYPLPTPPSLGFGPPVTWSAGGSGLAMDGVALMLTSPGTSGYQSGNAGLSVGAIFANGDFVNAVDGTTPNPDAAPVMFGSISAAGLLALGASNLPIADPQNVNQIWLNGVQLCVSLG